MDTNTAVVVVLVIVIAALVAVLRRRDRLFAYIRMAFLVVRFEVASKPARPRRRRAQLGGKPS